MQIDPERLVVVDVGAAEGLQAMWRPHADRITPVLFEPNPAEAVKSAIRCARSPAPW